MENKRIELKESLERKRASLLHTSTIDSDFGDLFGYYLDFAAESTPYDVAKRSSSSSTYNGYFAIVMISVLLNSIRSQKKT